MLTVQIQGQDYIVKSTISSNYIRLLKLILPNDIFTDLCNDRSFSNIIDSSHAKNEIATKILEGLENDIKTRKLACALKLLDLQPTPSDSILKYRTFVLDDGREEIEFHLGIDIQDLIAIAVKFEEFLTVSPPEVSSPDVSSPDVSSLKSPIINREKKVLKSSQGFKRP